MFLLKMKHIKLYFNGSSCLVDTYRMNRDGITYIIELQKENELYIKRTV